jgi:ubiquinone/menaquinone biosynthesis C-methylase UbiE
MGLYSKYIFPKIIESLLSKPSVMKQRKDILSHVKGDILEIGFGTGLNLLSYPSFVKEITVIDTNEGMNTLANKRIESSEMIVNFKLLNAESLPFKDETFDTVVSTFTFCSIENINAAMKEFHRVLKLNGQLIFLEHGLSPNKKISFIQNHINPFYKLFSEGCSINLNIKNIVEENGFLINELEQFYDKNMIKIAADLYKGIAVKSSLKAENI